MWLSNCISAIEIFFSITKLKSPPTIYRYVPPKMHILRHNSFQQPATFYRNVEPQLHIRTSRNRLWKCRLKRLSSPRPSGIWIPASQVTGDATYQWANEAVSKNVSPDLLDSCGSAEVKQVSSTQHKKNKRTVHTVHEYEDRGGGASTMF